jgi:hypothetical protein
MSSRCFRGPRTRCLSDRETEYLAARAWPPTALAAIVATFRCTSLVMILRRRFPPIKLPLRPVSALYWDNRRVQTPGP